MKALITALGICALLLAPAGAYVLPYVWDGASNNSKWAEEISGNNWDTAGYPAKERDGDTATINVSTRANPVKLIVDLSPYEIATLLIDADAVNAPIGLQIRGTGDLETTSLVTVKADLDTNGHNATLTVDAGGAFSPHSMKLEGAPLTANSDAILIFNQGVTVTNSAGVEATGFCQVRVGSDDTFDAYNLYVGDGDVHSELDMNTSIGLMIAEQLVVMGGDEEGEHGIFKVTEPGAEFYTYTPE